MLEITATMQVPDNELTWSFARSGGPGGQNVNKVASKAILRWQMVLNTSLPLEVRQRIADQQRRRLTGEGDLLITSQRFRDQERNREDCLEKLRQIIVQAMHVPRQRKRTRPSRGSKERRLAAKRHRSDTKAARRPNFEK